MLDRVGQVLGTAILLLDRLVNRYRRVTCAAIKTQIKLRVIVPETQAATKVYIFFICRLYDREHAARRLIIGDTHLTNLRCGLLLS